MTLFHSESPESIHLIAPTSSSLVAQLIECPLCHQGIKDPRTLPCLDSFCLKCLEKNEFDGTFTFPFPPSLRSPHPLIIHALCGLAPAPLRCGVCKMPYNGVKSLRCGVFIDSLTKSITSTVKDVNKVKCEGCDEEEAATMHCVDCGQNFGATCVLSHRKMKMSSSHQMIPLHDALKGKVEMKRIPRCKTFKEAVCPKCGIADHPQHIFSPLDEIAAELQDDVAGFSITMRGHEEEAKMTAKVLNTTLRQIEKKQGSVESDIEKAFAALYSDINLRHAQLFGHVDNVKKVAMKEKDEAEYAAAEFAGFCSFTEGLLTQGTPLEIAGSHKEVRGSCVLFSSLLFFPQLSHSPFVTLFRFKQEIKL